MAMRQRDLIVATTSIGVALLFICCVIIAVSRVSSDGGGGGGIPPIKPCVSQPASVFTREQMADADEFARMAKSGATNLLEKARAWAEHDIPRLICVCDICRNAGRNEELRKLALDALDVCRHNNASYSVLMRLAGFFDECADYSAARESLSLAAPLARNRIEEEDRAFALLRIDLAVEGATETRLEKLRGYAEMAAMNDNRIIAAQLLEKYGKQEK